MHLPSNGDPMRAMSWPAPTSNAAAMATSPRPSQEAETCSPSLFRGGKSRTKRMTRASAPAPQDGRGSAGQIDGTGSDPACKTANAATLQLASADARSCQHPKRSLRQEADRARLRRQQSEPKPQTPADIINSRGFWGDAADCG